MTVIEGIMEDLRRAGYEPHIIGDRRSKTRQGVAVFCPHGTDKNVRNAIPMWKWFFYGVTTSTIHEHDGVHGNDIIEIGVR